MKILWLILTLFLSGCGQQTTEISSGSYGPFSIGENKISVLSKLETLVDIAGIGVIPAQTLHLESLTLESMHSLDQDNGILVWLDLHPFPLRIEFDSDVVINKWGLLPCRASVEKMNSACNEIHRLNNQISIGSSRTDVYKTIITFDTELSKQAGNFLVGYQEYRTNYDKRLSQAYKDYILANDAWEFHGLKELSKFSDPFNSTVTLYFENDRLARIKHWSTQHELCC